MIQESIYNFLVSKTDLTAYVSTRIYWADAPQGSLYPQIVFKKLSAPKNYQLDDEWQRWRFFIFDEDKFNVDAIATLLKGYLQNLYGTVDEDDIDFITRLDESTIELRVEDKINYMYIDFRIIYH